MVALSAGVDASGELDVLTRTVADTSRGKATMSESTGPVTVISSVAQFEFRSLMGTEELGQPFRYDVKLLHKSATLAADKMIGSTMGIKLMRTDDTPRYLHGYVTEFSLSGGVDEFVLYSVTLRPWLHLLSHRTRCHIYKGTALDIVKLVAGAEDYAGHSALAEGMIDTEKLPTYEFVVQFNESDFNFFQRVLERDGIYYYFEHGEQQHKLVLTDDGGYEVGNYDQILYRPPGSFSTEVQESVDEWRSHYAMTVGKLTNREFSYKAPNTDLLAKANVPPQQVIKHLEAYDYPAGYFDPARGEPLATRRLETLQVPGARYEGTTNARVVGAGMVFSLAEHPFQAFNMKYLVYAARFQIVSHHATSGASAIDAGRDVMRASLVALEKERPFHPVPRAPKPAMPGVQSAIVVGEPTGDEIFLDDKEYCRVKVRFPWDPDADKTGKNSCWVRVSQNWAGSGFGVQFHPRLGQEVLVAFLEGDPDRPIIVGRVYNDENRPPYTKPTQSGIKTDSTVDKSLSSYNEIRFEDKAGSEELFVQAQKTHTVKVKGSRSVTVGGTQTTTVTKKETRVYKDTRDTTVEKGTDTLHVKDGLRTSKFDKGRDEIVKGAPNTLTVEGQDSTFTMGQKWTITTGSGFDLSDHGASSKITLGLSEGELVINAAKKITINVGPSTIELTPAGVSINGTLVKLNS
jgi:type VI secretion system secreted protein VgrG